MSTFSSLIVSMIVNESFVTSGWPAVSELSENEKFQFTVDAFAPASLPTRMVSCGQVNNGGA